MMAVCSAKRRQARTLIGMSECIERTEAKANTAQPKYSTKTAEQADSKQSERRMLFGKNFLRLSRSATSKRSRMMKSVIQY